MVIEPTLVKDPTSPLYDNKNVGGQLLFCGHFYSITLREKFRTI